MTALVSTRSKKNNYFSPFESLVGLFGRCYSVTNDLIAIEVNLFPGVMSISPSDI